MYVQTKDGLGLLAADSDISCQPVKDYKRPFPSARRYITEEDAKHIFKILCGPSPWLHFLRPNLNTHLVDLPKDRPIRIVNDGEFNKNYRGFFGKSPSKDTRGFVDRKNATIYLEEFPPKSRGTSLAGLALHEAVHLFSHPPGKSKQLRATAYGYLGEGLIEGLTQVITEDIQTRQNIKPLPEMWQAYKEYTPVARRFIRIFSPEIVGDAYFNGNLSQLSKIIERRWTQDNFLRLKTLAAQKKTDEALGLIDKLEKEYSRKPQYYRWTFR